MQPKKFRTRNETGGVSWAVSWREAGSLIYPGLGDHLFHCGEAIPVCDPLASFALGLRSTLD